MLPILSIVSLILTLTTPSDSILPINNHLSISKNVNRFGLRLLQELSDGKSNVFHSPFSIAAAMTMLMYGAESDTCEEINKTLGYTEDASVIKNEWQMATMRMTGSNNSNNTLAVGNKLLGKKGINVLDKFKDDLRSFDAEIELNQNDIISKVNEWVKQKTRGMIPKLVDGPMDGVVLAILNAVYFQGFWEKPFDKKGTDEDGVFYNYGTKQTKVAMMHKKLKARFSHFDEFGGFKLLELPYEKSKQNDGPNFLMVILLPDANEGLSALVEGITIDSLTGYRKLMGRPEVIVDLPRFKVETSYELSKKLAKMGVHKAFSGQADFSGITGKRDLYVDSVIHKAVIEVDEKGTKAAAATGIMMMALSMQIPMNFEFRADHPFLYFIIEEQTGMMLFCGTVNTL